MKILISKKHILPYCPATNSKNIYCAIRRGLRSENPQDYILFMHPMFILNVNPTILMYIWNNDITIECADEYLIRHREPILKRIDNFDIVEWSYRDTNEMGIFASLHLLNATIEDTTFIKVKVNQKAINKIFSLRHLYYITMLQISETKYFKTHGYIDSSTLKKFDENIVEGLIEYELLIEDMVADKYYLSEMLHYDKLIFNSLPKRLYYSNADGTYI